MNITLLISSTVAITIICIATLFQRDKLFYAIKPAIFLWTIASILTLLWIVVTNELSTTYGSYIVAITLIGSVIFGTFISK